MGKAHWLYAWQGLHTLYFTQYNVACPQKANFRQRRLAQTTPMFVFIPLDKFKDTGYTTTRFA